LKAEASDDYSRISPTSSEEAPEALLTATEAFFMQRKL
jgi:hypothetical protein